MPGRGRRSRALSLKPRKLLANRRRTAELAVVPLPLQLFLVRSAVRRRSREPFGRLLDRRRVDARSEIVARKTGAGGLQLDVGATSQQGLHGGRMPLLDRPHQSRRAAERLAGVDVRAALDQHFHCVWIAVARGKHQDRLSVGADFLAVRSGLQELQNHRGVAVERRHGQRRDAVTIGRLHVRAGADQHVGHLRIVAVHRPVQRRRPVDLRGVDVGLLREQRAHRRAVTLHRGVSDIALAGGVHEGRN